MTGKRYVDLGPATGIAAVTPHDTDEFAQPTRALWVGGAGNVSLRMLDGTSGVIPSVPAGSRLDVACLGVNDADTTATDLVAWF